jgi:L-seryl-tRNA(Ser) seleniumtransferase
MRANPLARALRLDKLSLAALDWTLVAAQADRGVVGGGSLPGFELGTWVVALRTEDEVEQVAARLRVASVPVLARVRDDQLLLDVRTLLDDDESALEASLAEALGAGFVDGAKRIP